MDSKSSTTGVADLLLRSWRAEDAGPLREAVDEDVAHLRPWLSWTLEEPRSLEGTRALLREWVEEFGAGRHRRYAIVPADGSTLILGGAHLSHRLRPDAPDVGYWVRRSAARRGVASAAAARLVVHAFDAESAGRVVLHTDSANDVGQAFALALGFELVGPASTTYPDGSPRPVLRYELARGRYDEAVATGLRALARSARLSHDAPAPPCAPPR